MGSAHADERLLTGYTGRLFVVVTLGVGAIKAGTYLIPPLLPHIIADLEITPFEAGAAMSAMAVCYALMQYPSGRLSDRLSRKTVLVASVGLLLAGFTLFVASPIYAVFLLAAAVVGAGDGFYAPASRALISDLFEKRRGQAFGVHMAFLDIGGVIAAVASVAALAYLTWRSSFLLALVPLAAVAVLIHAWNREPYLVERVTFDVRATAGRLFRDTRTRWLVVAYSLFVFTWRGVVSFLPTFLQVDHGFSPALASATFAGLFVAGIVVKPAAGSLSDRVPRTLVAAVGLAVAVTGLGTLVAAPAASIAILGVVIYGLGHKSFGPVVGAYLMDGFPDESMGGDLGAVRTVYLAVASLGPAYVGAVAGWLSYAAAFVSLVAALFAAAGITLWLALTE